MGKYHFYYDESEHSSKINLNTVNADNYYDNFIAAIVGWKVENEKSVFEKYVAFEEKYADFQESLNNDKKDFLLSIEIKKTAL